jgi:hypothetical protein
MLKSNMVTRQDLDMPPSPEEQEEEEQEEEEEEEEEEKCPRTSSLIKEAYP